MDEKVFSKYLKKCGDLPRFPKLAELRFAVVIPAFDELETLPRTLDDLAAQKDCRPTAVIVVVNHPAGSDPNPSLRLLEYLQHREMPENLPLIPLYRPDTADGVGEARKFGMDVFVRQCTAPSADFSWMWSLDADCRVDADYLSCSQRTAEQLPPEYGGMIFQVRHQTGATPELERAIRRYEHYLADYEAALTRAGSPYNYTAVGSAFAVRVRDYIRSGGMKQKKAGEDFYFLQELRKCSRLKRLPEVVVHPSGRISLRVPFGTGRAVAKLLDGEDLPLTLPAAETALAALLRLAAQKGVLCDGRLLIAQAENLAAEFLRRERFESIWAKVVANQPDDDAAQLAAFHRWFDALKTRRFLNFVTERSSSDASLGVDLK